METMMEELKNISNCATSLDTLLQLDKRAVEDVENNTHQIDQIEVLTIIREFIRCKNDLDFVKKRYIPAYLVRSVKNDLDVILKDKGE